MKRLFAVIAACMLFFVFSVTPQQSYIERYSASAVREMYRSGVPASITLAQGLLESRYGQSRLAVEANNHFGIKCFDWKGRTIKEDDDLKGECFRAYDSVDDSYADHSDFLRYRQRYAFLFDLKITDYKAWAHGLKKAGYATDPQYATKLIRIIEEYDLSRFDRMKPSDFAAAVPAGGAATGKSSGSGNVAPKEEMLTGKIRTRKVKKVRRKREEKLVAEIPEAIPASPTVLSEPQRCDPSVNETLHFSLSRPVYVKNGVPFIYSTDDDSYASIAAANNLFLKELLRFNDLTEDAAPAPGTVVYLQVKKNQTRRGLDKHIVEGEDESLRDICQEYAVKMSSIMKLNGFAPGHKLRPGDTVLLRKQ